MCLSHFLRRDYLLFETDAFSYTFSSFTRKAIFRGVG